MFSLIILVRPVNVIVILFLPFFYDSFKEFFEKIKNVFFFTNYFFRLFLYLFLFCHCNALFGTHKMVSFFNGHIKAMGFILPIPLRLKCYLALTPGYLFIPLFVFYF